MSVKVAVRVRPFNEREKSKNCQLCVKMEGNQTFLIDEDGKERPFTYDYSFWSHDQFENDENGYSFALGSKYADQALVFDKLGQDVLNNAWEGYNCCLFAYGQTGAGKSYSVFGYGANKGIIPLCSAEIFKRIGENTDPQKSFIVKVSMIEIYNEKVQDLLIETNERPSGGLKIRENKDKSVFVEGLSNEVVKSYADIEKVMEKGDKHRSIASTLMNKTSSRAHTIIQIEFEQWKKMGDTAKLFRSSSINLVDLAGSEKVGKTGAVGDRLKEASSINTS